MGIRGARQTNVEQQRGAGGLMVDQNQIVGNVHGKSAAQTQAKDVRFSRRHAGAVQQIHDHLHEARRVWLQNENCRDAIYVGQGEISFEDLAIVVP